MSLTVREVQQKNIDKIRNRDRERIMRTFGKNFDPGKITWDEGVSFRKLEETVNRYVTLNANDTAMEHLIQYGVRDMLYNAYMQMPIVYERLVRVQPSKSDHEQYPSMSRAPYPEKVLKNEPIAHGSLQAAGRKVYNEKYAVILPIDKTLIKRDKTGMIMLAVQQWAQGARAFEEGLVMDAISGATFSIALDGGGKNRPVAYGALDKTTLTAGFVALAGMKNQFGQEMAVNGNILLHGADNVLNAAEILMPNQLTPNILTGKCEPVFSARLGSAEAYLLQVASIVFQVEDPLNLVQEVPDSGADFERDEVRYKLEETCAVDVLDSRFIYKIN